MHPYLPCVRHKGTCRLYSFLSFGGVPGWTWTFAKLSSPGTQDPFLIPFSRSGQPNRSETARWKELRRYYAFNVSIRLRCLSAWATRLFTASAVTLPARSFWHEPWTEFRRNIGPGREGGTFSKFGPSFSTLTNEGFQNKPGCYYIKVTRLLGTVLMLFFHFGQRVPCSFKSFLKFQVNESLIRCLRWVSVGDLFVVLHRIISDRWQIERNVLQKYLVSFIKRWSATMDDNWNFTFVQQALWCSFQVCSKVISCIISRFHWFKKQARI